MARIIPIYLYNKKRYGYYFNAIMARIILSFKGIQLGILNDFNAIMARIIQGALDGVNAYQLVF